jgi:RNA polymerase sigma factor (TIGR02999 family)
MCKPMVDSLTIPALFVTIRPKRAMAASLTSGREDITRLLSLWRQGDEQALGRLVPLVYAELRGLARRSLQRERRNHTLQATALVHELFIRFARLGVTGLNDRDHFFAVAARAMRQILVAHARERNAQKRGAGAAPETYDPVADPAAASIPLSPDLVALDAALSSLAAIDPPQARIVELRLFGGYTIRETAALAGCSPATVSREWELARVWLYRELRTRP